MPHRIPRRPLPSLHHSAAMPRGSGRYVAVQQDGADAVSSTIPGETSILNTGTSDESQSTTPSLPGGHHVAVHQDGTVNAVSSATPCDAAAPLDNSKSDEGWLWQFLSALLSIVSLFAIVVILYVYDGKPIPQWPRGIKLNALVAVVSSILKAAMMASVAASIGQLKWLWFRQPHPLQDFQLYDIASRGPWGSLQLAFRLRASWLAMMGALITVLALATDTFTQQIIAFPLQAVSSGVAASILRAQSYAEADVLGMADMSDPWGVRGQFPDPSIETKASIYRALFATEIIPALAPRCPTGNCTFPVFDSLALCSKCLNVTSSTRLSSHQSGAWHGSDVLMSKMRLNLTYALPGNVSVHAYSLWQVNNGEPSAQSGTMFISDIITTRSMSETELGIPYPLLSLAILQFPLVTKVGYSWNYSNESVTAHECAFYFCVQTFNLTVSKGVDNTRIISTWDIKAIDGKAGSYKRPPSEAIARPKNGTDNVFGIDQATYSIAQSYLNESLGGVVLSPEALARGVPTANDRLVAMQNSANISQQMENIATSLTNRIRELYAKTQDISLGNFTDGDEAGALAGTRLVYGESLVSVPHVRIDWRWISLPALLVACSSALLLATILTTNKSKLPVWKESSLAVMFHGLGMAGRLDETGPAHRSHCGRASSEVVLQRDGDGEWRLQSLKK